MSEPEDHDALTCPQCQAMNELSKILGGFAEATQRLIDDGTFERWGREMAERRERAVIEAILGK